MIVMLGLSVIEQRTKFFGFPREQPLGPEPRQQSFLLHDVPLSFGDVPLSDVGSDCV
jgi:hypothetical protein